MKRILTSVIIIAALTVAAAMAQAENLTIGMSKAGEITINGGVVPPATLANFFQPPDQPGFDDFVDKFRRGCNLFRGESESFINRPDISKENKLNLFHDCKALSQAVVDNNLVEAAALNGYGVKSVSGLDAACVSLVNWTVRLRPEQIEQLWVAVLVSGNMAYNNKGADAAALVRVAGETVRKKGAYAHDTPIFNMVNYGREGLRISPAHALVADAAMGNKKAFDDELKKANVIVNRARQVCGGVLPPLKVPGSAYQLP